MGKYFPLFFEHLEFCIVSSVVMGLSLGEIDHNSECVKAAMNYLEKN